MKIRRYLAKDMRQALAQVRDQQGPDAVILSTRQVGEGVEVVAAMDFDPEIFAAAAESDIPEVAPAPSEDSFDFSSVVNRGAQTAQNSEVSSELNALRRMLETQLATLAWNDLTRRAPVHTEVLKELTTLGITPALAAEFVSQLPQRCELAEGQRLALGLFAHRIQVMPERWIEKGGRVALIGATGVGKTSTVAKIAARWVLRHGARDIALVSTDSTRIGAQDHIQTIGRLLGVPCYVVDNMHALSNTLSELSSRRLVLVDTAGLSQRDKRLNTELAMLRAADSRLECSLVLSGSAQACAVEEIIEKFSFVQPTSCILTKVDEAASLGGALSAIVKSKLPIAYCCDGQRLAEDIKPARAHQLVVQARQLARVAGATADEDLLSRRFGGISHVIA
jgi:flagellar biosynthesis protein FlhF